VKDNLRYLEANLIGRTADVDLENDADGTDKPDFQQAAELIKKFQGEVPGLRQLARKLEIRHEVDPELQKMLQQLEEASKSYASATARRSKSALDSKIKGLDNAIPVTNDRDEERENQSSEDQQAEEDRQAREAQQEADRKLK